MHFVTPLLPPRTLCTRACLVRMKSRPFRSEGQATMSCPKTFEFDYDTILWKINTRLKISILCEQKKTNHSMRSWGTMLGQEQSFPDKNRDVLLDWSLISISTEDDYEKPNMPLFWPICKILYLCRPNSYWSTSLFTQQWFLKKLMSKTHRFIQSSIVMLDYLILSYRYIYSVIYMTRYKWAAPWYSHKTVLVFFWKQPT